MTKPSTQHESFEEMIFQDCITFSRRHDQNKLYPPLRLNAAAGQPIFLSYFFMWAMFKVFIESVISIASVLYCGFFRALWDLVPQPVIEPAPPALEGKVFITGPPGESFGYPLFVE